MVSKEDHHNLAKWIHPNEAMQLHKLKCKKKQLQNRINRTDEMKLPVAPSTKRKNPFKKAESSAKRGRSEEVNLLEESTDGTLFSLFNLTNSGGQNSLPSASTFANILNPALNEPVAVVRSRENRWMPIDWALKTKVRLLSSKPFPWNPKLKINEEASGVTSYVRCLNDNTANNIDISPNTKLHQCCLYWQQPNLPWLSLFPRNSGKTATSTTSSAISTFAAQPEVRDHLYSAWASSLRSLFQLVRTRQCPYFYMCANNFTMLLRAAGMAGAMEMHAMITPSTRGLRHLLKKEDIEFSMPLKRTGREGDVGGKKEEKEEDEDDEEDEEEEGPNEEWLESMGVCSEDIKQFNYAQEKVVHQNECEIDFTERSLVLIEGTEVHALYNFLINTRSLTATTGTLVGVPPTLLAPVAFQGATLNSLKVRENKVHAQDTNYCSLELIGPILPHTLHSLFELQPPEHSATATFAAFAPSAAFSKVAVARDTNGASGLIFGKENLSDCGLIRPVLELFCQSNPDCVQSAVECVKYEADSKTFTWS